jgi:hypothetical protein
MARSPRLPARLRSLFWDHDAARLRWDRDRDLIVGRLLAVGGGDAIRWLRTRLGDADLRAWLLEHRGAGLSPRQLRFWECVLGLPRRTVTGWLKSPERAAWDRRRVP